MDRIIRRYIKGLVVGGAITVLAVYCVNRSVDPYHIYGEGQIETKPELHENLRFHKLHQVERINPTLILLGSSRVYHGLNPASRHIGQNHQVYNYGIPACRIAEIRALIEHSNNIRRLEEVVIGLDFFAFDIARTKIEGMPWEVLRRDDYEPSFISRLKQKFKATVTVKSFVDTLKTVYGVEGKWDFYHRNGYLVQDKIEEKVSRVGGYYHTMAYFLDGGIPDRKEEFEQYIFSDEIGVGPFSDLKEILEYANKHNIRLKMFISPIHAVQMEYISRTGYKPIYDKWRERLAVLIDGYKGNGNITLWDFSGYNAITTEKIPDENDRNGHMSFYVDASHYKPRTGDLILQRIMGVSNTERESYSDFGRKINKDNFKTHLEQEDEARLRFYKEAGGQNEIYRKLLKRFGVEFLVPHDLKGV